MKQLLLKNIWWILFIALVVFFSGAVFGFSYCDNNFREISIYKSYSTENQTFIGFEPLYKINIKDSTFTWDDWTIEVK